MADMLRRSRSNRSTSDSVMLCNLHDMIRLHLDLVLLLVVAGKIGLPMGESTRIGRFLEFKFVVKTAWCIRTCKHIYTSN